jgi:WD40 repeat protein
MGHSGELYAVCFSPDGLTVAACGTDATIGLWNVKTLEKIGTLRTHGMGADVAFSPDGQWLGGAVYDGTIHLWHAPALQQIEASRPRVKRLR